MTLVLPRPTRALVIATQSLLAALFFAGVTTVVLLPGFSGLIATSLPEYASLRPPLLALAITITVLALIALGMIALLVHRIYRGTVLSRPSLLWVDVIIATLACAVLVVVVGVIVIDNGQAGSPFLALILLMACLGLSSLACITLVLRSLLRQTILIRDELNEVI